MTALEPFPAGAQDAPGTPPALQARGYRLRPAVDADIPRLRQLYADTRAEEMAGVPWPPLAKQSFLDQQFTLQHQHFLKHYADADFLVIEHQGQVQGRYYLQRTAPDHLVVDICLLAPHRGLGVGRALIEDSQRQAQALGRGMWLHVMRSNPAAARLYARLGFAPCGGTDTHQRMRWPDATEASAS